MSNGFDANWLALREPTDGRARNADLVALLADHAAGHTQGACLLDIGCGTGSTYRILEKALPSVTGWRLLDYDPMLLAEAERRTGPLDQVSYIRHDLGDIDGLALEEIDIVTASALFDLCSADFCARFVARLAAQDIALYAALNYDGAISWTTPHPLDRRAVADFNRHQQTDKGFGPALGPQATDVLRALLVAHGYQVTLAESPWQLGPDEEDLHHAFLDGFKKPLVEIAGMSAAEIGEWLDFRHGDAASAVSSCVVGHFDLLALPA